MSAKLINLASNDYFLAMRDMPNFFLDQTNGDVLSDTANVDVLSDTVNVHPLVLEMLN